MHTQQDPCLIRTLKGHKESIMSLDLHPSCKYIASAAMDNVILLWDINRQLPPNRLMGHKNQINDLKFSPNGNLLVSASSDESLKFWEVDFDSKPKEVSLIKAHNARIRSINFSCDGLLLSSCGDDKLVKVWSTVDRRHQFTLKKHQNWVRYNQFSPTGTNIVSCDDKKIIIWDLTTKKAIQTYQEHNGVIHQAKFHSLGNCMASCSHDKKIKIYDLRSQHVIQIYQGHQGPVKSIDFHPHCPYLISSSEDNTTKIWNSQKGKLQYTLETHSNNTIFSRQGDYFVSGGSQKSVNIWKCGFFDSMKEKILESQSTVTNLNNKRKVIMNLEETDREVEGKNIADGQESKPNLCIAELQNVDREPEPIIYNHMTQNFELLNPQGEKKQISYSADLKKLLPQRVIAKLQKISNQIDFISKTTQILQTRIINNGEQLKRIVQLAEM